MRQIKFRAWDYETQKMLGWVTIAPRIHELYGYDKDDDATSLEFMQFTGLLDKNGKEIYEGDVLEDKSEDNGADFGAILRRGKYEVVWSKEYCCFSLDNYFWHISETQAKRLEVIGNIYENPDLIKQP